MRRRGVPVAAVCFVLTGFLISGGQALAAKPPARGPSTPEERAKAVELVKTIEADPLGKDAADARRWLIVWTTEVPDINVNVCAELSGPALDKKYKYSEIAIHPVFAQTKFAIEHPDKADDKIAAWTAGTEGMLRVYETVLKTKSDACLPFLDDLVARRDKGELGAFVQEAAKKCKG